MEYYEAWQSTVRQCVQRWRVADAVKIPFNLGCSDVLACLKLLGVLLS